MRLAHHLPPGTPARQARAGAAAAAAACRRVVGWPLAERDTAELARRFVADTIATRCVDAAALKRHLLFAPDNSCGIGE